MALRWCAAGMGEAAKQFRGSTASSTCPLYESPSKLTRRELSQRNAMMEK